MRRYILFATAIIAACIAGAGKAAAQAEPGVTPADEPIAAPRRILPNFDILNLVPVLDDLGIRHDLRQNDDGRPFLTASIGDRFAFNIVPTACLSSDFSRCIGVNIIAFFGADRMNPQTISAFNQNNLFTSVGLIGRNEGVFLVRYEIADYGIPRGNLASSLMRFAAIASRLELELISGPQTVSAQGFASDLAAGSLNQQQRLLIGAAKVAPAHAHDPDLAAAAALADALFRSGAPVNEIRPIKAHTSLR